MFSLYLNMNSKHHSVFSVQPASTGSNLGWSTLKGTKFRRRKRKTVICNCCVTYKNTFCRHIKKYCQESSLHGVHYIIEPKSHQLDRFLWFIVCTICIFVAIFMMRLVWRRFQDSPTVTNVETTNYPIWNIPFPAVTVCNNNKVYRPAVDKLVGNLSRIRNSCNRQYETCRSQELQINSSVLGNFLRKLPALIMPLDIDLENVEMVQQKLLKAGYKIDQLMIQLAVPCEKMLLKCIWLDEIRNCTEIFHMSKSVLGICCSFNYFGLKKEYRVGRVNYDEKIRYVSGAGNVAGLSLFLDVGEDTYFAPMRALVGMGVLFHDPMDYPETSISRTMVEPQRIVTVSLNAQAIESAPEVKLLNIAQRQCWFEDEQEVLKSTTEYSYETCITECRIKVLNDRCGCTPFFYPNFNKSARICNLLDTKCLRLSRPIIAGLQPQQYEGEFGSTLDHTASVGMNCSCLPQCTDKNYIISSESTTLRPGLSSQRSMLRKHPNMSILHVNFGDITCMKYSRNAYMTWDAVVATFGGIFGLCMGGSVISLFELIYRLFLLLVACVKVLLCHKRNPQRQSQNIVLPWSMNMSKPQLKFNQMKDTAKMFRNRH